MIRFPSQQVTSKLAFRDRDEKGSGSVLALTMVLVSLISLTLVVILGSWVWCSHKASNAADLAALSGSTAFLQGNSACAAAEEISVANQAQLVECSISSNDSGEFLVEVRVVVLVTPQIPGLFEEVYGIAQAGSLSE